MINSITLLLPVFLLCSCAISKQVAPIEYNHNSTIRTNNANSIYKSEIIAPSNIQNNEDIVLPDDTRESKKYIYHEVKIGETIESIAHKYDQDIKEIARLNGLMSPYYVDEFQILKIHKNKAKKVKLVAKEDDQFIKPVSGKIISKFGDKTKFGTNKGINIEARSGSEIMASISGKVVYSSYDATYGNLVIIKANDNNLFTSYAHMKSTELSKGDHVHRGEVVGYVGSTGKVSSPQLYFGIREGKRPKDPMDYLR
ncbi:MAG: hypothetical protein DGJ47_000862 [Rickettsiaceae bacterium]